MMIIHKNSSAPLNPKNLQTMDSDTKPIATDLIIEILLRLPIKPLLRFMCVSKSWFSLISNPQFIKAHFNKHCKNNNDYTHHRLVFSTLEMSGNYSFDFNLKHCSLDSVLHAPLTQATKMDKGNLPGCHVDILGSCNGLILVYVPVSGAIFLWNPSIRKSKKLPRLGPRSISTALYGCAYDEANDDYTVFEISRGRFGKGFSDGSDGESYINVYSLNKNSWRMIWAEGFEGCFPNQGVFFGNGKLHCITSSASVRKIVSLDLTDLTYGEVEQPKYDEGFFDWTLRELGGCLSIFCYYRTSHVDAWVMKEYGVKESWTKLVLNPTFIDPFCENFYIPVFQLKDGKILFSIRSQLALYNPKDNSLTYPNIHLANNLRAFSQVEMYFESLLLLNNHDRVKGCGHAKRKRGRC